MVKIGIIGGSGLDNPNFFKVIEEIDIKTRYGDISSKVKKGFIGSCEVLLLARHGIKHTITPSNVNYLANISALKNAGATHILATTACGSLKKEIDCGHIVILDQFIDFTRFRKSTIFTEFEPGKIKHTSMAEPFNNELRELLIESCKELKLVYHPKGTVVTIEGPRFSTRAESKMFQKWGADVINMSVATEAIIANEMQIPYATVAMSTDYDCWKTDEKPVTWEEILKVFEINVENVINLILKTIPKIK